MTTLPISNESMARGITRRILRESPELQRKALIRADGRYAPTRRRRGPLFRAGVKFMDDCLQGRILDRSLTGKGKTAQASWIFWEVRGEPPRPAISFATLDGRHNRLSEQELVRVSQHALQRLLQRLRTEDPSAALRELLPAASQAATLYEQATAHGERYAVHLTVATAAGEAVLVWEDAGFLVKTWIHHDSMNDQRCAQWSHAVTDDDFLCA
jgi:hypothetical protein